MKNQATGKAMMAEIITSFKKSVDNNWNISFTEAPRTLRMLISFVLSSAVNVARPNNPKHAITIATIENNIKSC